MKYPAIPVASVPESAWNRMLAPIFAAVDRITEKSARHSKNRKATKRATPVETGASVEYADKTA